MKKLLTTLFCLFTASAIYANLFLPSLIQFSSAQLNTTFPENFPFQYYHLYIFTLILLVIIAESIMMKKLTNGTWKKILTITTISNCFLTLYGWAKINGPFAIFIPLLLLVPLYPVFDKLGILQARLPINVGFETIFQFICIISNTCVKFLILYICFNLELTKKRKWLFFYLFLIQVVVVFTDYKVLLYLDKNYKITRHK